MDECVFYRKGIIMLVYVDDEIIISKNHSYETNVIKDFEKTHLNVTYEGNMSYYLGVHIENNRGQFHLSQPTLIQ